MANSVYPKALEGFLKKQIDIVNDNIKMMLVDSTYTYSTAHQFVSDVTGTAIIKRASANLSSKTETSGTVSSANYTFGTANGDAPPSGKTIAAVIIYDDTPAADTGKQLLAFIDHDSGGAAISLATNGSDVAITVNGSGLFSI